MVCLATGDTGTGTGTGAGAGRGAVELHLFGVGVGEPRGGRKGYNPFVPSISGWKSQFKPRFARWRSSHTEAVKRRASATPGVSELGPIVTAPFCLSFWSLLLPEVHHRQETPPSLPNHFLRIHQPDPTHISQVGALWRRELGLRFTTLPTTPHT